MTSGMKLSLWLVCLFGLTMASSADDIAFPTDNLGGGGRAVLKTCIDDSDCAKLDEGNKFRCFMYICYPWKDDSAVPEEEQRQTCRHDNECTPGQECFRHHDKRNINKGLCFDEVRECERPEDCSTGHGCCGGYCCESKYYSQFTNLPCISDLGCQDLGLGKYCCPRNNGTNHCCNTNPRPAPTHAPSIGDKRRNSADNFSSSIPLVMAVLFAILVREL